jgi:hypothetical protein
MAKKAELRGSCAARGSAWAPVCVPGQSGHAASERGAGGEPAGAEVDAEDAAEVEAEMVGDASTEGSGWAEEGRFHDRHEEKVAPVPAPAEASPLVPRV